MKPFDPQNERIDAILLEMAAFHPYLSAEVEAAIKARLLAIMIHPGGGAADDAETVAGLFRKARTREQPQSCSSLSTCALSSACS